MSVSTSASFRPWATGPGSPEAAPAAAAAILLRSARQPRGRARPRTTAPARGQSAGPRLRTSGGGSAGRREGAAASADSASCGGEGNCTFLRRRGRPETLSPKAEYRCTG